MTFRLNSLEQATRNYQNMYFNPLGTEGTRFMNTMGKRLRLNIVVVARQTIVTTYLVLKDVDTELAALDSKTGNPPNP